MYPPLAPTQTPSHDAIAIGLVRSGCSHCKELEPVYTEAAAKLSKLAQFSKIDATAETKLAARHDVSAYPTILVFHSGTEIGAPRFTRFQTISSMNGPSDMSI
jgi:thiol-disulfide isomerase/thioredoxin